MAAEKSVNSLINSLEGVSLEGNNNGETHRKIIDLVLNKKRNIFLSGSGGVGKSWLITNILKKEVERREKVISITSTTGVSALAIGGTTIYRWGGIKLGKESITTITTNIRERNKDCLKRWRECHILVIDEISMLGMKIFNVLDRVGRNICNIDLPFGGKQLIVSGDFLQLPPVQDVFAFKSDVWEELNFRIFRMIIPKRYPDIEHFNMLMRIRVAQYTKEDVKKLYDRVDAYIDYIRKGGDKNEKIKPTRIYSLKKDVEQHNLEELSKLPGNTIVYNSIDKFISKNDVKNGDDKKKDDGDDDDRMKKKKNNDKISSKDIMDYTEFLDTVVDRQVFLKPGAQVMLTYNLAIDIGLVNGSRGVILSCESESVNVLFKNGVVTRIAYHLYEFEDGKVKMMRYQLPLILAWACSIHKTQGATLDYAIMDLGPSIFAPGMGYVALSRVRTIDGLLLSSFVPKKIIADPEALEFEREIIEREKDEDIDYDIERGGGVPQQEGRKKYKQEEVTVLRGSMRGETIMVDKIPEVDKQLIAYITTDCPEIYEIMTPEMWNLLKKFDVPRGVDDETLYNKLLEILGLESGDAQEVVEEEDDEPGKGPVEDVSSSDDEEEDV